MRRRLLAQGGRSKLIQANIMRRRLLAQGVRSNLIQANIMRRRFLAQERRCSSCKLTLEVIGSGG